jgi:hypothetical protein
LWDKRYENQTPFSDTYLAGMFSLFDDGAVMVIRLNINKFKLDIRSLTKCALSTATEKKAPTSD